MRSLVRRSLVSVTVATALALLLSTTALGGAPRPDGRVRLSAKTYGNCGGGDTFNNPWIGDNVYNTTANNQTDHESQYSGGDCFVTWKFQISIQNAGPDSDRFKVKASGPDASYGWKLTYMHGSTNVTSAVVAGTYRTAWLGAAKTDTLVVKAKYLGGQDLSRLFTITSVSGGSKDAVKIVIVETP